MSVHTNLNLCSLKLIMCKHFFTVLFICRSHFIGAWAISRTRTAASFVLAITAAHCIASIASPQSVPSSRTAPFSILPLSFFVVSEGEYLMLLSRNTVNSLSYSIRPFAVANTCLFRDTLNSINRSNSFCFYINTSHENSVHPST